MNHKDNQQRLDFQKPVVLAGNNRISFKNSRDQNYKEWQIKGRQVITNLLGLSRMHEELATHIPFFEIIFEEKFNGYARKYIMAETEPDIKIPFWLLIPNGSGPFPVALIPHGHTHWGADQNVGIYRDIREKNKIEAKGKHLAIQAVSKGFIAIAPVTRGFAPAISYRPDHRHGGSTCRTQFINCLYTGRTPLGERLWDTGCILDYVLRMNIVDTGKVVVMGHSGGGVVSTLIGALDQRISVVVNNCAFAPFIDQEGKAIFCDCNTIPGILEWLDFPDIAGFIAPRPFLILNGIGDSGLPFKEVEKAATYLKDIYSSFGSQDRLVHTPCKGGNMVYKDKIWEFLEKQNMYRTNSLRNDSKDFRDDFPLEKGGGQSPPNRSSVISLKNITQDNVLEICNLAVHPDQSNFIKSNAVSIAQASVQQDCWIRAIYADEIPVGFFMVKNENTESGIYYLWRFMIGYEYQGNGFGRKALMKLIETVKELPKARQIYFRFKDEPGHSSNWFSSYGFKNTNEKVGTDGILRLFF